MAKSIAVIFAGAVFAYLICLICDMPQALEFLIAATILGVLAVVAEFVDNRQKERRNDDNR